MCLLHEISRCWVSSVSRYNYAQDTAPVFLSLFYTAQHQIHYKHSVTPVWTSHYICHEESEFDIFTRDMNFRCLNETP